jgi:hypothetical protein
MCGILRFWYGDFSAGILLPPSVDFPASSASFVAGNYGVDSEKAWFLTGSDRFRKPESSTWVFWCSKLPCLDSFWMFHFIFVWKSKSDCRE